MKYNVLAARASKVKMFSSDSIAQCEDRCVLNLATGEITPLMVPLPDAKSQVHI